MRHVSLAVVGLWAAVVAGPQNADSRFEVASIKASPADSQLIRAKKDRSLPPSLTRVDDCASIRAAQDQGPPVPPGTVRPCRYLFGAGDFESTGATLGNLATALSRYVGRLVLDKTDTNEDFAFELKWDPRAEATGSERPTLAQALDELGLKLQSGKARVQVLVVDHIERPSEN